MSHLNTPNAQTKQSRARAELRELLEDPDTLTVSVSQAAEILGICRSTASNAYRKSGQLTEGVRVLRIGKRCVVPAVDLRSALGIPSPY